MKKIPGFRIIIVAFVLAIAPLVSMAETTFFSDNFTGSSTLDQSPTTPPLGGASYQTAVGLAGGSSNMAPNDLSLTFPTTSGVLGEIFALFTNTPVALTTNGDHIAITVVFVGSNVLAGLDSGNATLNIGLFYSGGVAPNQGHIVTSVSGLNGGTQGWIGYIARFFSSGSAGMLARPAQGANGASTSQNQDLLFSGASSSQAFNNPNGTALLGGTAASNVTLTNGAIYTMYFSITQTNDTTLVFTNTLYAGAGMGGPVVFSRTNWATGATLLTSAFDGMAIGWRNTPNSQASTMDISSIQITGRSSPIPPPVITAHPVPAVIATNGSGAFFVTASGVALNYQWKRNGTNLINSGNISGATSPTLVISPAGTADQFSGANGYYVTVYNLAGSTNSVTNSLTLRPATNLVWSSAGGNTWDVNTTASWLNPSNVATVFNYGDAVTLDDTATTRIINLVGTYLSAASVTVDATGVPYRLQGSGSLAGPGNLILKSGGTLKINTANTYTGGTIISNAGALLYLENYNGLGNGPVNLVSGAIPGLEIVPAGSSSTGINGDINVVDDFTIQLDGTGSYTGVFYGNLSGTAGKTLTLTPMVDGTTNRFRVYGTNTVFDANLVLNGTATGQAVYNGSVLAPYNSSGSQTYNGIISGNGGLIQRDSGTTILKGANTYVGGTTPSAGIIAFGIDAVTNGGGAVVSGPIGTGPLFVAPEAPNVTGNGQVMAWGGARIIANQLVYPSGTNNLTLIIGGTNNLTFISAFALSGYDNITTNTINARTIQVTNTGLTTISGVISDATNGVSAAYGLIVAGSNGTNGGTLALNNTETYTGPTTVTNAAKLQVNGSLNAASTVTVVSNATLAGTGTINGAVKVQSTGVLAPGAASIGTLNIGGGLTNAGNVNVRVNRSGLSSDKAVVGGMITNAGIGTVTVTNLGATLVAGDKFFVFNKGMSNGATMTIAGAGINWTNNLALDGSITAGQLLIADMAAGKSGPATVITGSNYTYTIMVTNLGTLSAANVVVTDTLPAGVTFISASGGGVNIGGVVNWALGGLNSGQVSNLTLTVTAPLTGSLTNTASVSSATLDTIPANNTSPKVVTTVVPNTTRTNLTYSVSGSDLTMQWPLDHTGWRLLVQTNHQNLGISLDTNDWDTVAGSSATNSIVIPFNLALPSEFYRMVYP